MAAIIEQLIDKEDTNEIVRNKIGVILAEEVANQKKLAFDDSQDPKLWDMDIYIERSKPWEVLTDNDGNESGELKNGLVNVVFDNDSFDNGGSANLGFQRAKGVFFIDCYGHKNKSLAVSGDESTSKEADRIARLVRNILMHGNYLYLGLQGVVTRRYILKREKLQPDIKQEGVNNVIVSRLTLSVEYDETTDQAIPVTLEDVFGECKLEDSGQVLFDVDFDYTI